MKAFYPSLKSAFSSSFSRNGGLVQTTPKRSLLKDQETGVIDESPSGVDTLWIRCGYLLMPFVSCDFLLERFDLLTKSVLKIVCAVNNVCRIDLLFD